VVLAGSFAVFAGFGMVDCGQCTDVSDTLLPCERCPHLRDGNRSR
jgi:hypothetical protein